MKVHFILIALLLPIFCSCTKLVWTEKPLVTKPSDHDFEFNGKWRRPADEYNPNPKTAIEISLKDGSDKEYTIIDHSSEQATKHSFTVARLNEKSGYGIVQIDWTENESNPPKYFYFYAMVKNDRLFVWYIHKDKIIEKIRSQKLNALINQNGLFTEISSDPKRLLELLQKNSGQICCESPITYERE